MARTSTSRGTGAPTPLRLREGSVRFAELLSLSHPKERHSPTVPTCVPSRALTTADSVLRQALCRKVQEFVLSDYAASVRACGQPPVS